MTFHPFSTPGRIIRYVDAIAQCQRCKQTTSYDAVDAYERKPLICQSGPDPKSPCGGELKLYGQVI